MSHNFELVEISELKQALQNWGNAREILERNLREIQTLVEPFSENLDIESDFTESKSSNLDELNQKIKGLESELKIRDEKIKELENERRLFIQQVTKAAFSGSKEIYRALNLDNEYPLDRLYRENKRLNQRASSLEQELKKEHQKTREIGRKNEDLILENQNITGAYERLRLQYEEAKLLMDRLEPEVRDEFIIDLIKQVTPNRLARHMIGELNKPETEKEKIKNADRLKDFLCALGLEVCYPLGSLVKVTEQDIVDVFDLDETFQENCGYEVIVPGFKINGKLIFRPRIKRQGDEQDAVA